MVIFEESIERHYVPHDELSHGFTLAPRLFLHFLEAFGHLLDIVGKVFHLLHLADLNGLFGEAGQRFAHSIASSFEFTRIIQ
jgi:hypothetical protein